MDRDWKGNKKDPMVINFPNMLTLSRIGAIPVIVMSFYFEHQTWKHVAVVCFIIACITDFLDGYLARLWSQTTKFGQIFDPIADKLLIAATLLLIAGFGRIHTISFIPALVILCREIFVSGLREFLKEIRIDLPVSNVAKWKTVIQMLSLSLLLVGDINSTNHFIILLGEVLLWIAASLTLYTGYQYYKSTAHHIG